MTRRWMHALVAVQFLWTPLCAQQGRGTISGTVTDDHGAVVAAAKVAVRNTGTNGVFHAVTNENGFYTAPALAIGDYEVSVEVQGFKRSLRTGITLEVDQKAIADIKLELGQVAQSMMVVAETPLVDSSSATVGKVVENRRIDELPLDGGNTLALALLTPAVRTSVDPTYSGFADRGIRISTMSVNNGPGGMNDQLLDGSHNILTYINEVAVPPAGDAVQEFKVQSGSMSAEFGYTAGGVVNLATKSGTNKLHGTLYESLRNDVFDARNAFGVERERLRYNRFGGSAGGRVIRDRTFFFASYDEYHVRQGSPKIATVPVEAERKGDYSNTRDINGKAILIYDPASTRANPSGSGYVRDAFPNNVIAASRLDPVSQRVLALIPLPNRTPVDPYTNSKNYQTQAIPTIDSRQYNLRIDHRLTTNNLLFGRMSWFEHDPFQKQVIFPGDMFGRKDDMANKNAILSDTHTFSPTLINEVRLGLVRQAFGFADASYGQGWPAKLGLPSTVPNDVIPTVSISGISSVGYGIVGWRGLLNWNLSDMVTHIRGNHTRKFGFEYRLIQANNRQTSDPSGDFKFTATITGNPQKTSGTGTAMASMVLGAVRTATVDQSQGISMHGYAVSGFVQDDWKLSRRITVNLGLRYDFQQQPVERYDRLMNFDMEHKSAVSGLLGRAIYASVAGEPRQWRDQNKFDFGPRVGLAWDIFGKGKTVVRVGYGIYYPFLFYNANFGSGGTGFESLTTTYVPTGGNYSFPAFLFKDGFPYAPLKPLGAAGGDDAFLGQTIEYTERQGRAPLAQQWVFSVQQQLPGRWLIDITYSGNKGTHFLTGNYDFNGLDPQYLALGSRLLDQVPNPYAGKVTGALGADKITRTQSLLPFPYYGAIAVVSPRVGNYASNLLLISAERKVARGLTLMLSYTAGKLISDALQLPQSGFGENGDAMTAYQDGRYNRRLERSIDPQDVSQRMVISALYSLPFGRQWRLSNAFANKLVRDWQLNTIGTMQTGLPLSVSGANNHTADRPDSTGVSAKLDHPTAAKWFDTAAFINPVNFTYGNLSRTLPDVRSPGAVNWDVSIMRTLAITERMKLQMRAESFNLLNHVNLGMPNTGFSPGTNRLNASGSFGVITSARNPRRLQFGLKLRF